VALIKVGTNKFFLQNVQIGSGAHPVSYPVGTGISSRRGMVSTHLQLTPRLRMSGTLLLLVLYAFMTWIRKTLLFYSQYIFSSVYFTYSVPRWKRTSHLCRAHRAVKNHWVKRNKI